MLPSPPHRARFISLLLILMKCRILPLITESKQFQQWLRSSKSFKSFFFFIEIIFYDVFREGKPQEKFVGLIDEDKLDSFVKKLQNWINNTQHCFFFPITSKYILLKKHSGQFMLVLAIIAESWQSFVLRQFRAIQWHECTLFY